MRLLLKRGAIMSGDPVTDAKRYRNGDVVLVKPDDFVFGAREDLMVWLALGNKREDFPNEFVVVDVTGNVPFEVAEAALVRHEMQVETMEVGVIADHGLPDLKTRRVNTVDLNGLPDSARADIAQNFRATVPWGLFQSAIVKGANNERVF